MGAGLFAFRAGQATPSPANVFCSTSASVSRLTERNQRATRGAATRPSRSTSSRVAMEVSPGVAVQHRR
jgi:hypothetical protein